MTVESCSHLPVCHSCPLLLRTREGETQHRPGQCVVGHPWHTLWCGVGVGPHLSLLGHRSPTHHTHPQRGTWAHSPGVRAHTLCWVQRHQKDQGSFGCSVNLPLGSRSVDPHSTAVWCGNLLHSSPQSHMAELCCHSSFGGVLATTTKICSG